MVEKILNMDRADTLAESLLDIIQQEGYPAEEALPALMLAAADLVVDTTLPTQALDEAINLLVEEYEAAANEEMGLPQSDDDDVTH